MPGFKQSFAWWCVSGKAGDPATFMRKARDLGYRGVELLPREMWDTARNAGLTITADGVPPIEQGLNRRENHARIEADFRAKAELAKTYGVPHLIVFSGNRDGLPDDDGARVTIEGLKRLAPIAESLGVNALLELLNSKVDHKDYQCDHADWGAHVVNAVGSPGVTLLYDIYHMQIMEGDVINAIRKHINCIGHVHTAGVPGRHDIDDTQEINYRGVMKALDATGYRGWVTQEFMPRGEALPALKHAFDLCNV